MLAIETSGSFFERGKQHGSAFARQTRALYRRFCNSIDLARVDVRDKLQKLERNIQAICPEILDELHGIADGAGMDYMAILLLNSSVEFGAIARPAGCSNFVMAGTPHGILHGMNHDVDPEDAMPFVAGERLRLESGSLVKRMVWTGTVWTAAATNSYGLTFGESTVWVKDTNWEAGVPVNILISLPILRCTNVSEAVALLKEMAPVMHGYNFVFTDSGGNAAVVERSPTKYAVRYIEGRALYCSNSFRTQTLQAVMADMPEITQNSNDRWYHFEQIAGDKSWMWDIDGLQATLRDHSKPGGACQHASIGQAGLYSAHSYIMIPAQNQLIVSDGLPCRHPYLPLGAWID
jgi:predicted choloylglycine hydrolase